MSSTAILAAGLVRDKVATVAGCTCAAVDLVPDYTLQQVSELTIVVCPQGLTKSNADAGSRQTLDTTIKVSVAVLDRCEKSELAGRLELTEGIADALVRSRLTSADGSGYVLSVEYDPLYGMEEWRQAKTFIATLTATVKVL